jgi:hypothetical protein
MFPEVIDSSMMASFKECPAKFNLQYIQEWKPRGLSTHLHAGASFAHGLERARRAFYEEDQDAETSVAEGVGALLERYGDHQPGDFGSAANKSALRMAGALEFYFSQYPLNHDTAYPIIMPGGKRGIEFNYTYPLGIDHPETGQPILYTGRSDGIFQFSGGTYIFDDKTASQLGPTWAKQWKLRAQFSGYVWLAQQCGIKVDGVVVRGISILKNSYGCAEDVSFRGEYMLAAWYTELLSWISHMKECYRTGVWCHNFDHACSNFGGCEFDSICDMEDAQSFLAQSHERRHWDPITRTETKL